MDEEDPSHGKSPNKKAQDLRTLSTNSLSSSISKLSSSSRALPAEKDFHFYYNFDEFKNPLNEIKSNSTSVLQAIGSSSHVWSNKQPTAFPGDLDDAYDWLVNVNDDVFERFDASVDEFKNVRKVEEETGRRADTSSVMVDDGFQLVNGRKKKGMKLDKVEKDEERNLSSFDVKVASKALGEKPRVPFHVPSIPRPQTKFNILVNNSNQPFEHVWLQRSEDGSRFVHPLENFSVLDFVDKDIDLVESVKPLPVECSTFKLIDEVKDLKELAAKLRSVNEFAVDLEHNQYRSFQGLTCLMQISTRTEDFIIDTLKLRIHVGPYLREVFKDPTKKKVMHGADRDIVWLQRDFGIYVCNLFDTGQASRVLNLERHSLEYLLNHFCGVTANKEYQNADWRIRPLPDVMTRYAREDTHYLLHIYDLMKIRLQAISIEGEDADTHLIEVYKRSYDVCMQLYEKELLTDSSYLHIYGLQTIDFSAQQLAIVAALCEWRDVIARAEDESTGYILPNKTLLLVAQHMPDTPSKLRRLLRSKHPYIEQNSAAVSHVIKHAIQIAAVFESIAAQLKEGRLAMAEEPEFMTEEPSFDEHLSENGRVLSEVNHFTPEISRETPSTPSQATGATVQVLKKPSRAFGALLGISASKRKFDTVKDDKEKMKLEQIKSSVNLPFHTFSGNNEQLKPHLQNQTEASKPCHPDDQPTVSKASSDLEEVIMLGNDSDVEDSKNVDSKPSNDETEHKEAKSIKKPSENSDEDNEPMSLSELSSNFRKCFQPNQNQTSNGKKAQKMQEPAGPLQIKPFDYNAALQFKDAPEKQPAKEGHEKKNSSGRKKSGHAIKKEESGDFQQGKRRQAFPASGNRSATFS